MLLRVLLLVLFAGIFSLDSGLAGPDDDKENQSPSWISRRKKITTQDDKEDLSPKKRQKKNSNEDASNGNTIGVQVVSTVSPVKAERDYFDTFRIPLALEEYKQGKKKTPVKSPDVRKLYKKNDPGNYFSGTTTFQGKTLFQVDNLFDPEAEILKKSGGWETNLERMKKGKTPVCYNGIVSKDERSSLPRDEIRKKQKYYRIELQHVTQKDTGTDEDPICEMTHAAHMGKNARLILEQDTDTQEIRIVHTSLEKDEAVARCETHQFIATNVLYFRKGPSLIDRTEFDLWRTDYWKNRAAEIEKSTPTPSQRNIRRTLFDHPKRSIEITQ